MNFDTQDAAIEKLLRARYGQWVPCYELADLALQYCRAVNSIRKRLRQAGDRERVVNKVERVNGKAHGSYRIVRSPVAAGDEMKETVSRAERDDFYETRGPFDADPPAAHNNSPDWFERQTGRKRPAPPQPLLGPLFRESGL